MVWFNTEDEVRSGVEDTLEDSVKFGVQILAEVGGWFISRRKLYV